MEEAEKLVAQIKLKKGQVRCDCYDLPNIFRFHARTTVRSCIVLLLNATTRHYFHGLVYDEPAPLHVNAVDVYFFLEYSDVCKGISRLRKAT